MAKKKGNQYKDWLKRGVPAVLIPGLIFASMYGVKNIDKIKDYYSDKKVFPQTGIMEEVEDGDTFRLNNGQTVRLVGIDAPNRGKEGEVEAREALQKLILDKKLWLEYDRYQDDKYGRILAWIWIDCENSKVKFTAADYMHLSGSKSREYIEVNPAGCQKGKLVNRVMVDKGFAITLNYDKRGRLKYKLGE